MTRTLLIAVLLAGLACLSTAQRLTPAQREESDRVLKKIRTMELYNQILPVLMTADQAKVFLPIIERHRAEADKFEVDEHRLLLALEKEVDKANEEAKAKGTLPDAKILNDVTFHFRAFLIKREALIADTVSKLKAAMNEKLNAGQVKAAAHAFNPVVFGIKEEDLTEDKRLDHWVRAVLMDNQAYPILLEISKG